MKSIINKTIKMKQAIFVAVAGLVSVTANALPTTTIHFNDGSYCGSYTGSLKGGRLFLLTLGADQELVIPADGDAYVDSVKDPRSRILDDEGDDYNYVYVTKSRGQHTIRMHGEDMADIQFCVY